jgi:hypothetical protein
VLVIEPIGLQMPARPEVPLPLDPKAAAAAKKGAKAAAAKASAASGVAP